MRITLTKFSVGQALSYPGTMDMVFYKDENSRLYRLRYVDNGIPTESVIQAMHRVMCVSEYAPSTIEGEIIDEFSDEIRIKAGSDVFVFQRNAERLKYWDAIENREATCDAE
jgi:hypothetical protein